MKFGVAVAISNAEPPADRLARLERIARAGFDGVELHLADTPDLDSIRVVRDHLTRFRLEATVADTAPSSIATEPHIRGLIDACAVLDAHLLCGLFQFTDDRFGVAMLAGVAAHAGELGVTLALGGRDDSVDCSARTLGEACRLVDAVGEPNLGVLYNTYQAHVAESSISGAILSAGARLRHVQIAENDNAAPGTGQVGWSETFAALDAIGYDGWYVIEARRDEDVEGIAVAGLRFLHSRRRPIPSSA